MQGNEKFFFLAIFCILVISIYPANAQYRCLTGEVDLDTSTNKSVKAPTATVQCDNTTTFCMTIDKSGK